MNRKYGLYPLTALAFIMGPSLATAAIVLNKPVGIEIPDGDASGLISEITFTSTGQTITSIEVDLITESGWNGDLYAYLEHDGVISVLLNRAGVTSEDSAGAASSGLNVSFADLATSDIHTAISRTFGELVTGTYQPDGRLEDPALVTDTSTRSASLSGFTGLDAAGSWTLFVADLSDGDAATLTSWTLTMNTVPEPSALLLFGIGAMSLFARRRVG